MAVIAAIVLAALPLPFEFLYPTSCKKIKVNYTISYPFYYT